MRLNKEPLQDIPIGEQRVKSFFTFLPYYTKEDPTGRWLEKVTVLQEVVLKMNYGSMDYGYHKEWEGIRFIDNDI